MLPEYKEPWKVVEEIGSGSFGTVYRIEATDELSNLTRKEALKVIRVPKSDEEIAKRLNSRYETPESVASFYKSIASRISKELSIMYKLRAQPNIVSYGDHIVKPHEDGIGYDIMIQMQLLTPLETYEQDHNITLRDVIRLGIDICQALEICQKFHIIHRDIKPANIFVSDTGEFRLGDFGIARTLEEHTRMEMTQTGTRKYMAPEVYKGKPYGFDVDMYSLGLVMYEMLNYNRLPFCKPYPEPRAYDDEVQALNRRIFSKEELPEPAHGRTRLFEIVKKACQYEPKDRYSSPTAMKEDLQNILYTQEELDEILNKDKDVLIIPDDPTPQPPTGMNSKGTTIGLFGSSEPEPHPVLPEPVPEPHPVPPEPIPKPHPVPPEPVPEPKKNISKGVIIGGVLATVIIVASGSVLWKRYQTVDDNIATGNVSQSVKTSIEAESSSETEKETESPSSETEENKGPRTTSEVGDAGITINKEYDSNNNMIRENQIHPDGTQGLSYEYTYPEWVKDDEKHENWLTETSYHADGKLWTYSEREYEKEQMIKQSDYDSDHQMTAYAVYEWNEEGKKSGYTEYLPDDTVVKIHSFTYESNGSYKEKVEPGDYGLGNTPALVGSVPIGFIVYEYNVSGQQVKELDYNEDGELLLSCQYKYDYVKVNDQFRTTQQDWILADGTVVSHAEYQYNDEGNTTDVILFDAKGKIMTYTTYENNPNGEVTISQYDENHSILRRDEYDEEGTLINTVSYGTYEEDQQKDN